MERSPFVMTVDHQLHSFLTVTGAGEGAQVVLRVADGWEFLSEHHKNRFRQFEAAHQQIVQRSRAVDNDDVKAFYQEAADLSHMLVLNQSGLLDFFRGAQDRETQLIASHDS